MSYILSFVLNALTLFCF